MATDPQKTCTGERGKREQPIGSQRQLPDPQRTSSREREGGDKQFFQSQSRRKTPGLQGIHTQKAETKDSVLCWSQNQIKRRQPGLWKTHILEPGRHAETEIHAERDSPPPSRELEEILSSNRILPPGQKV